MTARGYGEAGGWGPAHSVGLTLEPRKLSFPRDVGKREEVITASFQVGQREAEEDLVMTQALLS